MVACTLEQIGHRALLAEARFTACTMALPVPNQVSRLFPPEAAAGPRPTVCKLEMLCKTPGPV